MTEVKTIKCEIHRQNGESIHAAFPAVPGIWEREEIYVEVSENRSYGCRYGQIRLNMRQGALRKEKPIRVSLPTVQSPEKITAMYMLNDWWTRPAFVEGFQEIPARTQVAFLKYPDRFACLVPMVGKTFKTYLEAGRVFCWIGNQAQINKENTSWVSYGAIAPENEAKGALPINQSAGTGWIQTFVSKSCDEPEKVAEFLSWVTSEEGLMMDYYGIEGEYYTVDDKGIVTKTEKGEQELKDLYENNILFWPFANTSFERHTEPVPDPTSNRGVEIALMPAFGREETTYIYDSSLVDFPDTVLEPSSDLGIKLSQVKSYLESQKAKIVTAKTDEEFETEYNNMVSTLEDYSIADIDAAYDEVYKTNCENTGNKIEDINADLYK